jgi:hypothetical protein
MADFKLYKVTRRTGLVGINGEYVSVLTHTVTAGGAKPNEAVEEAKFTMLPRLVTDWDARELTDSEYAEHYSNEGGDAA